MTKATLSPSFKSNIFLIWIGIVICPLDVILATEKSTHKGALIVERVRGIEPPYLAWEANVLPLNYTRNNFSLRIITRQQSPCLFNMMLKSKSSIWLIPSFEMRSILRIVSSTSASITPSVDLIALPRIATLAACTAA